MRSVADIFTQRTGSSNSLVRREGLVVRNNPPRSVLFFDDEASTEIFVPYSQIKDWHFTASGSRDGLELEDLKLDDEVELYITKWLAKRENLI